jgi:(5-formylfuran-3-yl)methyl phosphate synthase
VAPGGAAPALLAALACCDAHVVPVLLADGGVDMALVETAIAHRAFTALMLDTADKGAGSLLQRLPQAVLQGFVARLRHADCLSGLAGSLRSSDLPALRLLSPGFAGFRSAVCAGPRDGALDAQRVHTLCRELREPLASAGFAPSRFGRGWG